MRDAWCPYTVHLSEEWCGCCDDWWDGDLAHLSGLADMAGVNVSCDVVSEEGPPVAFCDKCMCHIVTMMPRVVMHGMDCLDASILV